MKICEISYSTAKKRHPKAIKKLIAKLRGSKSKHKNINIHKLKWRYKCCLTVDPSAIYSDNSFSITSRIADRYKRTTTVLCCVVGRWLGEEIVANPIETKMMIKREILKQKKEQDINDSLIKLYESNRVSGYFVCSPSKARAFVLSLK